MPLSVSCPHCGKSYRLADQTAGQTVRCTNCQQPFPVSAEPPLSPTEELPASRRPAATDMAAEPIPPAPKPPRLSGADEDVPRPRPVPKVAAEKPSGSLLPSLLAGGCGLALVLLVGCGGLLWAFFGSGSGPTTSRRNDPVAAVDPFAEEAKQKEFLQKLENPPAPQPKKKLEPVVIERQQPPPFFEQQPQPNPPMMQRFPPQPDWPNIEIDLPPGFQLPPGMDLPPGVKIRGMNPAARMGPSKPKTPIVYTPHLPAGREEVALSGKVSDVAQGGGGRYLVLRLADKKKLAVFDVQTGKVAKELPLLEEVAHFAAGAEQLLVVYPNTRLIHYWSLKSLERERSAKLPDSLSRDNIHQICMGSASLGPLFVYLPKEKRTMMMDPRSLETAEVRWNHWAPNNAYGPQNMRAAPDGSRLVGWGGGWAGLGVAFFQDGKQVATREDLEFWSGPGAYAAAASDCRHVFSPWGISDGASKWKTLPELKGSYLVSAVQPGYFLALAGQGDAAVATPNVQRLGQMAFYTDDRRRLFVLGGLDELKTRLDLPWEKRLFAYPAAGLLVTLGGDGDRLVLRRVDLTAELDKSGTDYLVVLSRPPAAKLGQAYSYKLDVRAKKGGAKVKLENGPGGLKVSADGRVSWTVPPRFDQEAAEVLVTLSDAGGQEAAHTFFIPVER